MNAGLNKEVLPARIFFYDRNQITNCRAFFLADLYGAISECVNALLQIPIFFSIVAIAQDDHSATLLAQEIQIVTKRVFIISAHPGMHGDWGRFGIVVCRGRAVFEEFLDLVVDQPDENAVAFQESGLIGMLGADAPLLFGQ